MVLRLPKSWSNWNLEMLVSEERGKPECLEKNLLEQRREPTTNSTQIWHRCRNLNLGHILVGGDGSHHFTIPCSSSLASSFCCTCTIIWNIIDIFVVVQFCPWFEFYFLLFQTHKYLTLSYLKTKKNKIETKLRTKLDHNIFFIKYIFYIHRYFICISIQIIIHEQSL